MSSERPTPGPLVSEETKEVDQAPETTLEESSQQDTSNTEQQGEIAVNEAQELLEASGDKLDGEVSLKSDLQEFVEKNSEQVDPNLALGTGLGDPSTILPTSDLDTEKKVTDPTLGLGAELDQLAAEEAKRFHYSGVTDVFDDHIEFFSSTKRIHGRDGVPKQRILNRALFALLSAHDAVFDKVLDAVLEKIASYLGENDVFGDYKRFSFVVDPQSSKTNPILAFNNQNDFQFHINFLTLLCCLAEPNTRPIVLARTDLDKVFQPIQANKSYVRYIERFKSTIRSRYA